MNLGPILFSIEKKKDFLRKKSTSLDGEISVPPFECVNFSPEASSRQNDRYLAPNEIRLK